MVRRVVTARLDQEAAKVRAVGTRVTVLTPGPEDLAAMGANLMNPRPRPRVLDVSLRTSALALRTGPPTVATAAAGTMAAVAAAA